MSSSGRRLRTLLFAGWMSALGCDAEPPASPVTAGIPCTVEPAGPAERMVLVSEADAARAAGRKDVAEFVITTRGPSALRLELQAVGCNCYQVLLGERSLRVGDPVEIEPQRAARVQIVAEPATEPGVRERRATLVGSRSDGTTFTLTLAQSIRTLADIVVRPDVVQIDLDGTSVSRGAGVSVQIEQVVRARDLPAVTAEWGILPAGITVSAPVAIEPPRALGDGLWRVRGRSSIGCDGDAAFGGDGPVPLSISSHCGGVERARGSCVVLARRRVGIAAPPLVHLGRVPAGTTVSRRIQLRALDHVPFAVLSASSRDGTVAVAQTPKTSAEEHWIEIRVSGLGSGIDDELAIETDHAASPRLLVPVRALR